MPKQDYYETLGVKREASEEDIRKSYRRLARKHHPDLNPGDKASEDRFKKVQEAYDILSDAKKRQMYDQYGFYSEQGLPPNGEQGQGPGMGFGGFDFTDVFTQGGMRSGEAAGGFRDVFGQFFGSRAAQQQAAPQKGSDLEYALNVDFWQAVRGAQVRFPVTRHEQCGTCHGTGASGGVSATCPECSGSGSVSQTAGNMRFNLTCPRCAGTGKLRNACPTCHGEGRVALPEPIEVRIPAGTPNGSRLRVAGKGNAGSQGAPAGDLYITIRVEPHSFFERDGDDIRIKVPVTVSEAGLGAKIDVPTIDGRARLNIPPGTQNGQRFRMREKGVQNARRSTRGDQIVEVSLQAPKVEDERTKELLRELATLHAEDPRAALWKET